LPQSVRSLLNRERSKLRQNTSWRFSCLWIIYNKKNIFGGWIETTNLEIGLVEDEKRWWTRH